MFTFILGFLFGATTLIFAPEIKSAVRGGMRKLRGKSEKKMLHD